MIVVDTNIIAYLYLTGDRSDQSGQLLAFDPEWCAPLLWRSEFRSVLTPYLRRERLSLDSALRILERAEALMAGNEYTIPSTEVMSLVMRSRCSPYDCEFVALARQLGVPLVSADQAILREFPDTARSIEAHLGA